MNKPQFLRMMREAQTEFKEELAALDEAQLTGRSKPDTWSIKEALAHLTYWEQYMLNNVREARAHGKKPQWVTQEEEDAINADILRTAGERSLDDVLTAFHASSGEVLAEVETIPEEVLLDPNQFDWLNGTPLWQYIANESFGEHREEHLGHLLD